MLSRIHKILANPEIFANGSFSNIGSFSYLSKLIEEKYREGGYIQTIIYGEQGAGKTTYSIKVGAKTLLNINPLIGRDIDYYMNITISSYMVFSIKEFIEKLKSVTWETRYPFIIVDDAGVGLSAYIAHIDRRKADFLSKINQVIRTRTSALIMTTTTPHNILKSFREIDSIIIHINKIGDRAEARAYGINVLPNGQIYVKRLFREYFTPRLPDSVFKTYISIRDKYVDKVISDLDSYIVEDEKEIDEKDRLIREIIIFMRNTGRTWFEIGSVLRPDLHKMYLKNPSEKLYRRIASYAHSIAQRLKAVESNEQVE